MAWGRKVSRQWQPLYTLNNISRNIQFSAESSSACIEDWIYESYPICDSITNLYVTLINESKQSWYDALSHTSYVMAYLSCQSNKEEIYKFRFIQYGIHAKRINNLHPFTTSAHYPVTLIPKTWNSLFLPYTPVDEDDFIALYEK